MCDFSKPVHLFTDSAMGQGSGFHICQYDEHHKRWLPLAWGSHKYGPNERNWSQVEGELFSIIYAVTTQPFLLGWSKVIVHTDCNGICFLQRFSETSAKLSRWNLLLSQYDLHFKWEPSSTGGIKIADLFTRKFGVKTKNKRPKLSEIEQLPQIFLPNEPILSFDKLKSKISTILQNSGNDQKISQETINIVQENWSPISFLTHLDTPDHIKILRTFSLPQYEQRIQYYDTLYQMHSQNPSDPQENEKLAYIAPKGNVDNLQQFPNILRPINPSMIPQAPSLLTKFGASFPTPPLPPTMDKKQRFIRPYQPSKYIYQQHSFLKDDLSNSGRILNLVLQENSDITIQNLSMLQHADDFFGPIFTKITKDKKAIPNYIVKFGILIHKQLINKEGTDKILYQICIPRKLSYDLIKNFHEHVFSQHPHKKKLVENIKHRFFIKGLGKMAEKVIKLCQICTFNKHYALQKQSYGRKYPITAPRQCYAMDIATIDTKIKKYNPLMKTSFLVVVDLWSLYTICIPIDSDCNAHEIIKKFSLHVLQVFGPPSLGIVTDNAKNFSGKMVQEFCAILNIRKFQISPRNARANFAERSVRIIISGLRYIYQQFKLQPEQYEHCLNYVVLAWNCSELPHLGFSPYRLFFSTDLDLTSLYSFMTIEETESPTYSDFVAGLIKSQHFIEELVNARYDKTRQKRYDNQQIQTINKSFQPGSLIMIKLDRDATKRMSKLRPTHRGPFKILQDLGQNLEVIPWSQQYRRKFLTLYKNQGKLVPKNERFLVSKDKIKPASTQQFFFNDAIGRRFFNLFFETIDDIEPAKEVQYSPENDEIQILPKSVLSSTSLVHPHKIGLHYNIQIPPSSHNTIPKIRNVPKKPFNEDDDDSDNDSDNDPYLITNAHIFHPEIIEAQDSVTNDSLENHQDENIVDEENLQDSEFLSQDSHQTDEDLQTPHSPQEGQFSSNQEDISPIDPRKFVSPLKYTGTKPKRYVLDRKSKTPSPTFRSKTVTQIPGYILPENTSPAHGSPSTIKLKVTTPKPKYIDPALKELSQSHSTFYQTIPKTTPRTLRPKSIRTERNTDTLDEAQSMINQSFDNIEHMLPTNDQDKIQVLNDLQLYLQQKYS